MSTILPQTILNHCVVEFETERPVIARNHEGPEIAAADVGGNSRIGQFMSRGSHFCIGPVCCVSSLLFLAFTPSSFALGTCAAYGPNFALVEGTHTCVRIGGHMRVQFSPSAEADPFETGSLHANATSATLRSEGFDNDGGLRHMRVDTNDESYR